MTPNVGRLGLLAAGALVGALSIFIVMCLVFIFALWVLPLLSTVQLAEAPVIEPVVEPEPRGEPEPVIAPKPAPKPMSTKLYPFPSWPEDAPPTDREPASRSVVVTATSTRKTSAPIQGDGVEQGARSPGQEAPATTQEVTVVCNVDPPKPGWPPVKPYTVVVNKDGEPRVDCADRGIVNF
jgi:hypothetical protein